jgi:hypothetical protein
MTVHLFWLFEFKFEFEFIRFSIRLKNCKTLSPFSSFCFTCGLFRKVRRWPLEFSACVIVAPQPVGLKAQLRSVACHRKSSSAPQTPLLRPRVAFRLSNPPTCAAHQPAQLGLFGAPRTQLLMGGTHLSSRPPHQPSRI